MNTKTILKIAIVSSLYIVLTLIFLPFSFSFIQFRLSEILCILSIKYKWAIISLTLGCFLSNLLIGSLGIVDIIFGSLATLLSCLLAYLLRNKRYKGYPILSGIMIVLCNAIIIGIEYSVIFNNISYVFLYILQIGLSELIVISIGIVLYPKIDKFIDSLFTK